MFQFLVDQNFNEDIIRSLRMRANFIDLVLARDVGLQRTKDPEVLTWAAEHDRIVLTHDRQTMVGFASDRVREGMKMPGMFVVDDRAPIGHVVDDLLLVLASSRPQEWVDHIRFLPF